MQELTNQFLKNLAVEHVFLQILDDDSLTREFVVDPVQQHLERTKKKLGSRQLFPGFSRRRSGGVFVFDVVRLRITRGQGRTPASINNQLARLTILLFDQGQLVTGKNSP